LFADKFRKNKKNRNYNIMKHKYLHLSIVFVFVASLFILSPSQNNNKRKFVPREKNEFGFENEMSAQGAFEYLTRIRANQITKTVDIKDVEQAQAQLRLLSSRKDGSSNWIFRGPDNIGGRTRALLIDKDNSNIMYAGGVAGGLWRSTTAGQIWYRVQYEGATAEDFANLAIVSICQSANGDIYFGTGEAFLGSYGTNTATPMILGAGIWKSTDGGQTFSKLESTWNTNEAKETFYAVSELAADPTDNNLIYAATAKGLKVTTDGGQTWKKAPMPSSIYNNRFTSEVKIASNGTVIASVGNNCLLKKAGESEFVLRSGTDESQGGHLITNSDVGRLEFTFFPADPNYVYCIAATQNGGLRNIYKSEDGGDTWVIIGKGGSDLFKPLGDQGTYDICIAVNPLNKDEVYVGGLDLYVGKAANTGNLFAWDQITLWNLSSISSLYVHADLHSIIFDPKDPNIMFISCDGGVSRGFINKDNIPYQFKTMNKNYNVTQFFSVAINSKGYVLGGTQDNGSLIITGEGNTSKTGFKVKGGDGGHCAMSQINPSIAFATIYYGGLWRNNDAQYRDWNTFYSPHLTNTMGWTTGEWEPDVNAASFVTPIAYWETDNDSYSNDVVAFVCKQYYSKDTTLDMYSHNIFKAPIKVTTDKEYFKDDTLFYHDPYSSLFALGMKKYVWVTRKAANWNDPILEKDWWKTLEMGFLETDEYVTQMSFSADGNNLFFSTNYNVVYRLSNLSKARTYEDADTKYGDNLVTEITKIGGFTQAVTGISCDPNDVNNMIVTLGNYGNSNYVYLCTSATYCGSNSSIGNFTNITGNLPKAPVYCALFEMETEAHRVMLGTDLGVFMSEGVFEQISSTNSVNWEADHENVGPVPVFQIKQQINKKWAKGTYGRIYIGTHGLGFFENREFESISDEMPNTQFAINNNLKVKIYPNPVKFNAKVSILSNQNQEATIDIVNMAGQTVRQLGSQNLLFGENTVNIQIGDLPKGVYLLKVNTQNNTGTIRFIKH
jgi:photosystem II stability/assembly factor-like uncharacterized protein